MNITSLRNMNIGKSIYYTFFSGKVHKTRRGHFICNDGSILSLGEGANVNLAGALVLGANKVPAASAACILRMDDNAKLEVGNDFAIYYGADIVMFPNSHLKLGSGFINSYAKIRCHSSIEIGDDVAISHDFTVMDSDAHEGLWSGYQKTAPVKIGNHVWIGTRVTVLKGVTIGDGAIIGAGSVVTHDIPPHTLAVGAPARVIRENVDWRS